MASRLAELLASGKRSHEVLAASMVMLLLNDHRNTPRPDFAKLADSTSAWGRFVGIVLSRGCAGDAADARILKALKSSDELDRVAGLIACTMPPPDAQGAAPSENAAAFKEALLAALQSPRYVDISLAASGLSRRVPPEQMIALFQDEARRNPHGARAKAMLATFRSMPGANQEVQAQRQLMLLDVVLESKDADLQLLFARNCSSWFNSNKPLLLTMICDCEPEVLLALLADKDASYSLRNADYAIRAVFDRLKPIYEKGGPQAVAAVKGLAAYTREYSRLCQGDEELRKIALTLLANMLSACAAPDASDERITAACELLVSFYGQWTPMMWRGGFINWKDAPPSVWTAAVRVLAYADHKTIGPKVASLIGSMYRRFDPKTLRNDQPDLVAAMEAAHEKIMAGDRAADQVVVLSGMTAASDAAVAAGAQADLEMRFIAGTMPAGQRVAAVNALDRRAAEISAEFAQFLLRKAADRAEAPDFRRAALSVLARNPAHYPALLDVLGELAKAGEDQIFGSAASLLSACIQRELPKLKEQGKPALWARKAADLGLAVAGDARQATYSRNSALSLYAYSSGAECAPRLEAMAQDGEQEGGFRASAAGLAIALNPGTRILTTFVENYPKLPKELRTGLVHSVASARNTPGAEAFVLRVLHDPEMGRYRTDALMMLALPPTPTLIAGLKELEQDPEIGQEVKAAIFRLENQKK